MYPRASVVVASFYGEACGDDPEQYESAAKLRMVPTQRAARMGLLLKSATALSGS